MTTKILVCVDTGMPRVFSAMDYLAWLNKSAGALFGLSGREFAERFRRGDLAGVPAAQDVASVLPMIERLSRIGQTRP